MDTVMNLSGKTVYVAPEPGSLWTFEKDHFRWLYIAQDGKNAISIQIRKDTGKVVKVDLEAYIHNECREIKLAE